MQSVGGAGFWVCWRVCVVRGRVDSIEWWESSGVPVGAVCIAGFKTDRSLPQKNSRANSALHTNLVLILPIHAQPVVQAARPHWVKHHRISQPLTDRHLLLRLQRPQHVAPPLPAIHAARPKRGGHLDPQLLRGGMGGWQQRQQLHQLIALLLLMVVCVVVVVVCVHGGVSNQCNKL